MTVEEFQFIYDQTQAQGISGKQYCRDNDLPYNRWSYLRSKILREASMQKSGEFIKIQAPESLLQKSITIETPTGWKIHIQSDLQSIIRVLSV
jgi:hypothetical protein